jgi:hypothetical protein
MTSWSSSSSESRSAKTFIARPGEPRARAIRRLRSMGIAATLVLTAALSASDTEAVTNIRQVDFRNFTYRLWGNYTVEARGGSGVLQKGAEPADPVIASIQTAYGDLTGDGEDEAAVIVWFMAGGNGVFSQGFVYGVKDGKVRLIAEFEGGDRAQNGLWTVSIAKQALIVERESGPGPADTERIVTTWYRLDGEKLVPMRNATRKWDGKYPPGWRVRTQ